MTLSTSTDNNIHMQSILDSYTPRSKFQYLTESIIMHHDGDKSLRLIHLAINRVIKFDIESFPIVGQSFMKEGDFRLYSCNDIPIDRVSLFIYVTPQKIYVIELKALEPSHILISSYQTDTFDKLTTEQITLNKSIHHSSGKTVTHPYFQLLSTHCAKWIIIDLHDNGEIEDQTIVFNHQVGCGEKFDESWDVISSSSPIVSSCSFLNSDEEMLFVYNLKNSTKLTFDNVDYVVPVVNPGSDDCDLIVRDCTGEIRMITI